MMKRKIEKVRFHKYGGGSFRLADGKIIKPGQTFSAYPSEIPEAFRDQIRPVDKEKAEVFKDAGVAEVFEPKFEKKSKGGGWYDVVNTETGKVMNEASIREEQADELIKALEGK